MKSTKSQSPLKRTAKRFASNKMALLCLAVFLFLFLSCMFAPLLTHYDPAAMSFHELSQRPNSVHLLGTDHTGRDLYSRLLYGGRTTFRICFIAVVLSSLGLVFGLAAGYYGGRTDQIISRVNDALASIPTFLLAIFVEITMPSGRGNYQYAIALALMPPLVRLSRNLVMNIMGSEYIEAARALGVTNAKIIAGHVLRNISGPVIVQIFSNLSEAILTCTIMGYLGLGIMSPRVEWGSVVKDAFPYILSNPIQITIPCLVVFICVLSLNVVGSGLRDAVSKEEK